MVILPPVLVEQFRQQFRKFEGLENHIRISTFVGTLEHRSELIQLWDRVGWPDILVTTYRFFVGAEEKVVRGRQQRHVRSAVKRGVEPRLAKTRDTCPATYWGWEDFLKRGYNDLIVDEATAVKAAKSGIHKAVKGFAGPYSEEEGNGLLLMTGTPIENKIEDTYGLISLINPLRYRSYRAFERFHVVTQGGPYGRTLHYINLPYLTQSLYEAGRRILKKDVLKDLPPMLISEVPVTLHDDHHALYKKLVRERLLELGDRVIDATTHASLRMKVQQIIMTPEHFSEKKWEKNAVIEALDQVIEMINLGERKVVVFGYFQRSIEKLQAHYSKYNPVVLYGGTTGNRNEHIRRFKEDPACRMLIAQVRSGGYGFNLQDACSHVVFAEMISVPGLFQQAAERVHRPGQTESVTVYLLVVHKTVSVSIRNDLARKSGEAKEVTRDRQAALRDLLGEDGTKANWNKRGGKTFF